MRMLEPMLLWPVGAPGAMGESAADRPSLTAFLPEAKQPTACVIVCPGGAYKFLAAHEGEPVARWLCELGLAAAVLRYRVAPYRWPAPLADAQRAIRLVRSPAADWNVDPARVGILGFSAGGHLAAAVATMAQPAYRIDPADVADGLSARPDALLAGYPRTSFRLPNPAGALGNLLGAPAGSLEIQNLSLESHVSPATPPAFLWHTSDDAIATVANSLRLAGALAHHGVKFALHVFRTGRHGLGLAAKDPAVAQWKGLCAGWLREIGFCSSQQPLPGSS